MKVLAIDTSNVVMGIALVDDGTVKGEVITNIKKDHSTRAMPAIQALMADCRIAPKDLNLIVVAKGPGSYTGVRIGVTIAKTLAWTLNVPIVGVSSLEVLAANGRYFRGLLSPLFDARRGQIYTGLYRYDEGQLECVESDRIVLASEWAQHVRKMEEPVLFLGEDLRLHEAVFAETLPFFAHFSPASLQLPRPSELAFLGIQKKPEVVHSFVPNYIRLAEAEAKWLEMQKEQNRYGN
ncbi:tRNA threonylcarbamoyladenosine biosynthesis protein TsaB [Anoxybacillus voinovskiensis]|uniref:tRNA threonylcarbamoyladenosine biosynthesis protein TsaB n=1 Tax=Anoxybacteroides voinovskiense TaxID=230470 RepID=A0A840E2U1_9BACL|nr:tRNA (adenosine(37)-N6)-threonylcarbamoyltransferase complex dimerization subunit type 1 TsaB [Anoxybacillus voinovskiensis]MBB4075506.1 tRNA threonylcarbamoyladenosine biosynthesis protein TsaB [Anoxybacillus voinovskiensis]GGJ79660.1 tRNA (adenosine(37)-N6)-threonylcarbamoyltransferase complex dimerization subunit type 1 TsaB [Anoxybacillus voinovskiensis]